MLNNVCFDKLAGFAKKNNYTVHQIIGIGPLEVNPNTCIGFISETD